MKMMLPVKSQSATLLVPDSQIRYSSNRNRQIHNQ